MKNYFKKDGLNKSLFWNIFRSIEIWLKKIKIYYIYFEFIDEFCYGDLVYVNFFLLYVGFDLFLWKIFNSYGFILIRE